MEEKYPVVNRMYSVFIVLTGTVSVAVFGYAAVFGKVGSQATRWFLGVVGVLCFLGAVYSVIRAASVKITDTCISQGSKKIFWPDVTNVEMKGLGLYIESAEKKIVLAPWAFQEPQKLVEHVVEKFTKANRA